MAFTLSRRKHGRKVLPSLRIGDILLLSCSSPRWDNLPSGHQRNPLLGLKLGYMYWGQKDFLKNRSIPIHAEERGACIDGFFSFFLVYR